MNHAPEYKKKTFCCPLCRTVAKQDWLHPFIVKEVELSRCQSCDGVSIWVRQELVYPRTHPVDPPNADLNPEIQAVYNEAAKIVGDSPRGAAALLRLALQMLLKQLELKGENINEDIGALVKRGLDPRIQKALDAVRVIGNNAVHPGTISLDDDKGIALTLFDLINLIADRLISHPKEIDRLYETKLPDGARQAIARRDGMPSTEQASRPGAESRP